MVGGFHPGIVIQAAERHKGNLAIRIYAGHLGAAYLTEYLGEVLCPGQLEALEMFLTADKLNAVHRSETVARVCGRTCTATARAMTIVHHPERLGQVKLDGSTHATAANHSFGSGNSRLCCDTLIRRFRRIVGMARQVAGDVMPGRAVGDKYVAVRFPAVVVAACRGNDMVAAFAAVGDDGSASSAEAAGQQARRSVMDDRVCVTGPVQLVGKKKPVGGKGGAVRLTAKFAMAIECLKWLGRNLPPDAAAQTTGFVLQIGTPRRANLDQ